MRLTLFLLFVIPFYAFPQQKYGGVFRMNEPEDFRSLYPFNVIDRPSFHIAEQVYEGLVKLDPQTLRIVPSLAKSWSISADGLSYTFNLRGGVRFHSDPCFTADPRGRVMNAQDVKWCFDRLCTFDFSGNNLLFETTFMGRVEGADAQYTASHNRQAGPHGVSGVQYVDDSTIVIKLLAPDPSFIAILATPGCWIFPHEAYELYGNEMRTKAVGTGPFRLKMVKEGEVVFLERNPLYWNTDDEGNKLPYLDGIRIDFIKDKRTEYEAFKKNLLDMLPDIGPELMTDLLGSMDGAAKDKPSFQLQSDTSMSVYYLAFQHKTKPFNNRNVREAICLAIDRDKLVNYVLQGDGIAAKQGIVPPSVPGYGGETKGFEFDPEKARKLLAKAGYPDGKGFPTVELMINHGNGQQSTMIAEAVQNMLKENLGLTISVSVLPIAQLLQETQAGNAAFWRSVWVADYPDASCYLNLFYGKNVPASMTAPSFLNPSRYRDPVFDSLYSAALKSTDPDMRNSLLHKAETQAIRNAAFCPLYYGMQNRLIGMRVRDFYLNGMDIRDFSRTWFTRP